ncbi:MAG: ABC-F family ATP-binding cassette domain-containing protein [Rhodospirillales bacterium]|nr:ABC-F family ATP-binding cassette domain-containing protein [Rhodospirillales bacterium]
MLRIDGLTYRIAGRTLLENASAQISAGWRAGLVGRNGTGKSTLLDLIRGALQPDAGEIRMRRNARIGFVAQEAPAGDATPLDVVLAADTERAALEAELAEASGTRAAEIHARLHEIGAHAAPARAATILAGLGFDAGMQGRPMASFSGGWRMRVALAAALFSEPDLLLLDEPSNHLDLEAALWLEDYLRRWPRTLIVVSHDRGLLNGIATHILHLENQRLATYSGDYDTFVRTRAERLAHDAALAAKQEAQRARLQAFIDRFRAKASKARQAQSRLKALARLQPVATPAEDPSVVFDFPEPDRLPPPLVSLDAAAVGYVPGRPVLRRLTLRLDPGDRIALLGANGNGKTTLAKLLAGRLEPCEGRVVRAPKLRSGFFAQHQIEELDPRRTPVEHLAELRPRDNETALRSLLGRFGLGQEKALVPAGDLSGGEKARLTLALVTHDAPPLLVLDEPTNHLDIAAREALVEALGDWGGAVVLVTHDWSLLELVADRLWPVADGTARVFDGDLDDYRRHLDEERRRASPREERAAGSSRKDERRAAADRRRALEPLRRRVREAEAEMERLGREKARIDLLLADPATYAGAAERTTEALRRQADLARALAEAEQAWLAAAEALEAEVAALDEA